ncbi:MAG: 4-hydroxy-tetrahydrodipicolinate synthase [Sphaerochaeta sp.]|nr:4-hydroxy-tetrahydrodipicolinate synthase [Sphaerochaeta sp.]
MFKPQGIFTALVTPMNQDETVNFDELRNQVDRQIKRAAAGLFCLGTNGEFYALDTSERIEILDVIADQVGGRVPLIANVGCVTTRETVRLAKETAKRPVNAMSVIVPYFAAFSQEQLYQHYATIAKSVDIPIMIYNIPKRTGNAISLETVKELSKIDSIIGIKDSSGDIAFLNELFKLSSPNFSVLVGTDSLILQTLQKGGTGAVAGCANPFPEIMNGIYTYWKKGDLKTAQILQDSIVPFRNTFSFGNPNSIVKRAVELMGYEVGAARAPANIISVEIDAQIRKAIEAVNIASKLT